MKTPQPPKGGVAELPGIWMFNFYIQYFFTFHFPKSGHKKSPDTLGACIFSSPRQLAGQGVI
jgi:hypothetical protein